MEPTNNHRVLRRGLPILSLEYQEIISGVYLVISLYSVFRMCWVTVLPIQVPICHRINRTHTNKTLELTTEPETQPPTSLPLQEQHN